MPPIATSAAALSQASTKSPARYIASVGDSFSWAKASAADTSLTSPISTLVAGGTSMPAISAILAALWPTMAALRPPSCRITLRTASASRLDRM